MFAVNIDSKRRIVRLRRFFGGIDLRRPLGDVYFTSRTPWNQFRLASKIDYGELLQSLSSIDIARLRFASLLNQGRRVEKKWGPMHGEKLAGA